MGQRQHRTMMVPDMDPKPTWILCAGYSSGISLKLGSTNLKADPRNYGNKEAKSKSIITYNSS